MSLTQRCQSFRIDGRFKGHVKGDGALIVGETGVMESDVHAATVFVSGAVHGNIVADEKIELLAPARVFGDMESPSIVIHAGVAFRGNCHSGMKDEAIKNKVAFLQRASEVKNEA